MSTQKSSQTTTYQNGNNTLLPFRRVFDVGGSIRYADASELENGLMISRAFPNTPAGVQLLSDPGPWTMIADGAIALDAPVYRAANGKVSSAGSSRIGRAASVASADGNEVDVFVEAASSTPASTFDVGSVRDNKAALLTQGSGLAVGLITKLSNSKMFYRYLGGDSSNASSWEPIFATYTMSAADTVTVRNLADSELETGHVIRDYETGTTYAYFQDTNADPPDTERNWHVIDTDTGGGGVGGSTDISADHQALKTVVLSSTGSNADLLPASATTTGIRRRTEYVAATVNTTTMDYVPGVENYDVPASTIITHIDFADTPAAEAANGEVIELWIPSTSEVRDTGNILMDPGWAAIVEPTGEALLRVRYRHTLGKWVESYRQEF